MELSVQFHAPAALPIVDTRLGELQSRYGNRGESNKLENVRKLWQFWRVRQNFRIVGATSELSQVNHLCSQRHNIYAHLNSSQSLIFHS